jgi:osmotically-inducible protein OsmY
MRIDDSRIHTDVLRELGRDRRIDETEVGVEVDRGVVTLTGMVSTWAKRLAAEEAAHRVAGVLDVANDVEVRIPECDATADTEIARAVRRALRWNALVPHERVRSTVSDGWVTLAGDVDTWTEREDAARVVASVPGVHGVTDEMTVRCARLWGRRKPACPGRTPRGRASLQDVYAALMRSRARRAQIWR